MKKSRRQFIKRSSQFTLATGFSMWALSCDFSNPSNKNTKESFLEISQIFSDNMVLQRDKTIPIWGWTNPNATVELFLNEKIYKTNASENGKWIFNLPPISESKSLELIISQGNQEIKIQNILLGDVYLCSGQSNMEWPMSRVENVEQEIENAKYDKIRHFKVLPYVRFQPEKNLIGKWEACSPETVTNFSAAAYFFAKELKQKYDVPIGLVNSTRGESNIKMWLPIESLTAVNREELLKNTIERRLSRLEKNYQYSRNEKNEVVAIEAWKNPEFDDEQWTRIPLPMKWGESDFREMLGKVWFRKTFFIDKIPNNISPLNINIAQIDDADITFLNGEKIGEGKQDYGTVRKYGTDRFLLKEGKNVLAIVIENYQAFGGIFGNTEDLFLELGDRKISLAGEWKMKIESLNYNQEWIFEKGMIPSVLHNSMIHPLQNFPFRAVLWYQGESDVVDNNAELYGYRFLFEKLILSWRKQFGNQELPFIFAQISNALKPCAEPSDSWWARLRESQSHALLLKNTAQVLNIDAGKHDNSIHPQNKKELGFRFSLAVRKTVFGENIVADGPILKSFKIEGKYIYIYFSNVVKALLFRNGNEVNELTIAGDDRKFHWAKSRVEDDRIIVWNDKITKPVAVRYAWCDNPLKVNLYNSEGLPAAPFRTDEW